MGKQAKKTFVGFGFGPIQSGLFLYEAYVSGNFSRFVVAEIDDELVRAVADNGGTCTVNIARMDRIDRAELAGIELYNPREPAGRDALVAAVAESDELATSLPSVEFYDAGEETSVARVCADGIAGRAEPRPTVIYAAENNNRAAEILRGHLAKYVPGGHLARLRTLNTVIGKMSGVIDDPATIDQLGLATIAPGFGRAVLVEQFNRILVSAPGLEGYRRGIDVFVEKDDLLPFEEAKLYGHNAIHALIGFLADRAGCETIGEAGLDNRIMKTAADAFIDESGAALVKRHEKLGDPLFTDQGYREYAENLLERMVNPHLNDRVSRVVRDPVRKLGCADRLYGTMRLCLDQGVEPVNLALGAAAGVLSMIAHRDELAAPPAGLPESPAALDEQSLRDLLTGIWAGAAGDQAEELISLTWSALQRL